MIPNIGPLELVIVLVIALIVFGPKRLPSLAGSLGKGVRSFKDGITGSEEPEPAPRVVAAEVEPAPERQPTA